MLSFDKYGDGQKGHYWLMTVAKREFKKPIFCAKVLEFKENNEGHVRHVMNEIGECEVVDDIQGFVRVPSAFLPRCVQLRGLLTNATDKQAIAKAIWCVCEPSCSKGEFDFATEMWKTLLSQVEVPKELWLTVVLDSFNRGQPVPSWAVSLQISEDNRFDHTFGSGPADYDFDIPANTPAKCRELYNVLHVVEEPDCDVWSGNLKQDVEKLVHMF